MTVKIDGAPVVTAKKARPYGTLPAAVAPSGWTLPPRGRLSQPASNRRCPMNLPSAIPPGQAKTPPPVWVTNWFSMSNFASLSKILMKPVRTSRW